MIALEFPPINEILRWKDIVEAIEAAIDAIEDASDVVQSIVVKHA